MEVVGDEGLDGRKPIQLREEERREAMWRRRVGGLEGLVAWRYKSSLSH